MLTSGDYRYNAWWYLVLGILLAPFIVGFVLIFRALSLFSLADQVRIKEAEAAARSGPRRMTGRLAPVSGLKTEDDVLGSADDDIDMDAELEPSGMAIDDLGNPDTKHLPVPKARPLAPR